MLNQLNDNHPMMGPIKFCADYGHLSAVEVAAICKAL